MTTLTTTQVAALTGLPTHTGRHLHYPAGPIRRAATHRHPPAPPMDPTTARQLAALTGLHRMVWRAQVGAL